MVEYELLDKKKIALDQQTAFSALYERSESNL